MMVPFVRKPLGRWSYRTGQVEAFGDAEAVAVSVDIRLGVWVGVEVGVDGITV